MADNKAGGGSTARTSIGVWGDSTWQYITVHVVAEAFFGRWPARFNDGGEHPPLSDAVVEVPSGDDFRPFRRDEEDASFPVSSLWLSSSDVAASCSSWASAEAILGPAAS